MSVSFHSSGFVPIGILGQVWYLIVSIPDLCTLTNFGIFFNHDICVLALPHGVVCWSVTIIRAFSGHAH